MSSACRINVNDFWKQYKNKMVICLIYLKNKKIVFLEIYLQL